ncbi:hypothetical protein PF010_g29275 [Phytophthora fragariae]|uniref:Uncharacterized protein n=1 Tax=Phytophthora fragariae TaxID=53985 RepID=A0A6G0JNK4_9STRA|nr:hypothetical protein PF010_g29275 [Phytophthora fragariae]
MRLVGFMAVRKPRAETTAVPDVRQPATDKVQQSRCCGGEVRRGGSLRCRSCCRWKLLGTSSSARVDVYAIAPDATCASTKWSIARGLEDRQDGDSSRKRSSSASKTLPTSWTTLEPGMACSRTARRVAKSHDGRPLVDHVLVIDLTSE